MDDRLRTDTGAADGAQDDDARLLRAVAGGDRGAFETLYRRYHRRLLGYLRRWLDAPDQIEEALDDVMFVVWRDAGRFAGRSRVSTWIFGIAFRTAQHRRRQAARQGGTAEAFAERVDPERRAERLELRLSLARALDELSPDHRTVVELTYFEDCSYREIAEIVDCPVNTVKTRMFHARRHLRRILPRLGWTA